jgi:6,7-dimethyl-8-ribityllumazine synthase
VLTTDTLQQALERAGIKSNKGWEYAMAALEMATLMRQLQPSEIRSESGNHHLPAASDQLGSDTVLQGAARVELTR